MIRLCSYPAISCKSASNSSICNLNPPCICVGINYTEFAKLAFCKAFTVREVVDRELIPNMFLELSSTRALLAEAAPATTPEIADRSTEAPPIVNDPQSRLLITLNVDTVPTPPSLNWR
ncbi:unnamed protein product [Phytophthora lilii]|uniref:Unnamed protein product n=1 Tax=Phytophthora lilii TaxID=2077276 RepID=A0A9W6X8E3_9STRA|nr:unnamed protein product [Phytophthora lilii]